MRVQKSKGKQKEVSFRILLKLKLATIIVGRSAVVEEAEEEEDEESRACKR